jgi:hypothetical protein
LLLLNRNSAKRLGANQPDASELKNHEFFYDMDWEKIARQEYPVLIPKVKIYTTAVSTSVQIYDREESESERKFEEWRKQNIDKLADKPTWVDGWAFNKQRDFNYRDFYSLTHSPNMVPDEAERLARKIFASVDTNADGFLDKAEQTNMIQSYYKEMRSESDEKIDWAKEEEKMLKSYFQEMTDSKDQKVSLK